MSVLDIQFYTSGSGNWSKVDGAILVRVVMWGAGGGGGGSAGSGGTAGAAIDGDSYITYSVTGTISGTQIN